MKTSRGTKSMSCRALAKALGRSPSHICRVMRGERVSRRLAAQLRRCGVKIANPPSRCALRRTGEGK